MSRHEVSVTIVIAARNEGDEIYDCRASVECARPVHEQGITSGAVASRHAPLLHAPLLHAPLLHAPYATPSEYPPQLASCSRHRAEQHAVRGRPTSLAHLVPSAGRRVRVLPWRSGWRDRLHGVVLASLAAMSVAAKYAQLWALERGAPPEKKI